MAYTLITADELELEYPSIYGIVSPLRLLKLGYVFSSHPDLYLEKDTDVTTYDKKSVHACYRVTFLDDSFEFIIIQNKGSENIFYPRYKKMDYLICSLNEEEISENLISIFQNHRDITICYRLDNPNQKEILNFTQLL